MTTEPLDQVKNILEEQAIHLARVNNLNLRYDKLGWDKIEPDDVTFHEVPGKPWLLRYEFVNNTPEPVHASTIVGPKPIQKLTRWGMCRLLAESLWADLMHNIRRLI